jgi:Ca2+/Na+ antiporter
MNFLKDNRGLANIMFIIVILVIVGVGVILRHRMGIIMNWVKSSRDAPIIALFSGILIFVLIMTGPTLWHDWKERRFN